MKISKRAQKLTTSPLYAFFRKVKELEAQGKEIISLGVGEPFQDTSEKIKEAGIAAIQNNKTHYNPAQGSMELRKKIAVRYGVDVSCVSMSSGAKPFLGFVFSALLDEGDVVYMAGPVYPPFAQIVESCGGIVKLIDTKPFRFQLTLAALEETVAGENEEKTRYLLVNSPNNPTGVSYDKGELEKIVSWCTKHNFVIISDECYSNFSSDPDFSLRKFSDEVIVINSFSKTYAMTGWRVGWIVCPEELNVVIGRYLDSYIGCGCSISDAAAITALDCEPLPDFAEQREMMHTWLEKNAISFEKSTGGIFIFPDFGSFMKKQGITDSVALASYFLENASVATTPGISFGEKYDTHLRISYCVQIDRLKDALEKIESVMRG